MELTGVASAHTTLAQRLDDARRRRFIGRDTEVELFRSIVTADAPPVAVLFVHGPGGVGKTALLAAFARVADEAGATTVSLDGRSIEPSPAGFQLALTAALPCVEGREPVAALADLPRPVLLIDTYERINPLDGWLREEFLPHLPSSVLVVIAGRDAPSLPWRSDPGWSELVRVLPLRNLSPDASRTFLHGRHVPEEQHAEVLAFTHGHPLALSLVADVLAFGE